MKQEIKERVEKIRKGEVPEGYKETKVGIIPDEWLVKKIENVSPLQRGFDLPSNELKNGDYPVVYSNGIVNYHCSYKAKAPGVVTGRSGTIGKVTFVEKDYWPHNTSLWVTDFKGNDPKFIYYLYLKMKLERFGAGSGVPTLNRNDVHSFKIPLPSLFEQEKIVEILSTWDKAIKHQEKLIEGHKKLKKGLMQKLLAGKVRFPEFTDEWKEKRLNDILKVVTRNEKWNDKKLYNLVSVRRRSGGVFHRGERFGHQIKTKNLVPIKKNDFLISKMQVVHGALAHVENDFENYYVSGSYIILQSKDEFLNIKFFNYLTKMPFMYHKTYISSYGVHIEKMTFNLKLYLNEKIMVPSEVKEQKRIVQILDLISTELDKLMKELNQLKEQKRGLMQLLLTGIVRVEVD